MCVNTHIQEKSNFVELLIIVLLVSLQQKTACTERDRIALAVLTLLIAGRGNEGDLGSINTKVLAPESWQ